MLDYMTQKISKNHNVNLICKTDDYTLFIGYHLLLVNVIVTHKDEAGNEYIVRHFYIHQVELPYDINLILENQKQCKENPQYGEWNRFSYPTWIPKSIDGVALKIGTGEGDDSVVLMIDKIEFYILTHAQGFIDCVKNDIDLLNKLKQKLEDSKERHLVQKKIGLAELPLGYAVYDFAKHMEYLCSFEIAAKGMFLIDLDKLTFCNLYPQFIKSIEPILPHHLNDFTNEILAVRNNSTTYDLDKIYILTDTEYFVNGVYEIIHINPTALKIIFTKSADKHFAAGLLNNLNITDDEIQNILTNGLKNLSALEQFVLVKYHVIGVPLFVTLAFFDEILTITQLIDHLVIYSDPNKHNHETLMWNGNMLNTFMGILRGRFFN